jgi:hypothetical protein
MERGKMNRLTVVLSGRKQSGKNSTCNHILARYLNRASAPAEQRFIVNAKGELATEATPDQPVTINDGHGVKLYSFADPLKQFCINVFGAAYEQMYGTDAQKNSIIEHLVWENLPDVMRPFVEVHHPDKFITYGGQIEAAHTERIMKSGCMTGRELMQIFGTEMVRRLYADAWARATYSAIANDGHELALICDGRFPNEIEMGTTVKAKTVRLLRAVYTEDAHASETALDNYPPERYTVVVDNRAMTLEEQFKFLDPYIDEWFNEAGIR